MQPWVDFTPLLDLFSAQPITVLRMPPVAINPQTNEEYYDGQPATATVRAIIVPTTQASSWLGRETVEFLPQGVLDESKYIAFTSLDEDVATAEGERHPTLFRIDDEYYSVIRDAKWHWGNMRVLALKRTRPGPPFPT